MKVTLRKRNQGGKTSLYLDYYHKGKRKAEYLKLYLDPAAKTKEAKEVNKKTLQLAETIRAQRQIEIQNGVYGFRDNEKLKASFTNYIELLTEKRKDSTGNYGNWDSMLKHLKSYIPWDTTFSEVNREFVQGFKEFLDKEVKTKGNQSLSQNSKYSYFNKLRAALKQAVKDGIIPTNPAEGIDGFKQGEPQREFLTLEELQAAVKAECEIPQMKTAFIFSCLTGLRWSDINKLLWSEVQHSNEMGYYIRFRQKKTKGAETLPISAQAFGLLGERQDKDERVFKGLKYSAWHNLKLQQWMMKAGISKTITFHCARHTYATLQLSAGTDIYTVSKLLGHRELRTTQIYAKVIDEKKKEAANKIQLDL
ncbi:MULTISPECIES: site-specific integrase [Aequorivita]|uniref:Site-specific integrase n=2 Tax=Aequorivita TaxID=153265 RepID=A0AB35YTH7_9FLAO|nr:site-specific integrase [Aequorivita sp. Ant34-E75]WGF92131.1 site-specific integrase [Aequorivita sp. Ant34-E75]|tara:strand:- start:15116 stop:16210 length:1095 start_codon:yes stop_codon:yes gene_type:complete